MTLAPATEQPIQGPPSDEVTDLRQRLAILQQKRADDKARIKELEKYKAQLMQVRCTCIHVYMKERDRWGDIYVCLHMHTSTNLLPYLMSTLSCLHIVTILSL